MTLMSNIRINIIFTAGGSGKTELSVSLNYPQKFHERCVCAISSEIAIATSGVRSTNVGILADGSKTTKAPRTGKEADASWLPVSKPQLNGGGCDPSGSQPWPNLIVEVAYSQSEEQVRNKVEQYWLRGGRAHDAIAIKIDELVAPATRPSVMTAWHYCINNQTIIGALNPTMYEFGTVGRGGNQINLQPGQCVINIPLACLYHGVPANVINPPPPPPPQLPPPNPIATVPNPVPIDLYHVQFAILNN